MVSKEGVTGAHLEGWLPAPLVVICEVTLDGKLPGLGSVGQTGRNLCLNLTGLRLGERKGLTRAQGHVS